MGNLGDRYGRRPVLLGSLAGFSLNFALMAFAPSLTWLLIGQAIAGIFGGTYGPAQAALADISKAEDRARVFGMVGAAFGIGFVIGPVIGGLLGEYGHRVPFLVAAALAALNFIYGLTVFPETLTKENRRAFDWRRANPFGAFSALGKLPGIRRLGLVLLVWQSSSLIYPLTWSYYLIAGFGASGTVIGLTLAGVGLSMALIQIFLTGRFVQRFGERKVAMFGLFGATLACVGFLFGPHWHWALALSIFMPFQSLVQPSLTALVSKRGQANNQGEVQGFTASIMSLGSIIAPLLLNPVLAFFSGPAAPLFLPGAAFLIAALFSMLALFWVARVA